ncbi:MAG: hypothetical protein ACRAVC_04225 [Trichormus sp.]
MLKAWRDFLYIRKHNIGDKFFAVDQPIIHSSFSEVTPNDLNLQGFTQQI